MRSLLSSIGQVFFASVEDKNGTETKQDQRSSAVTGHFIAHDKPSQVCRAGKSIVMPLAEKKLGGSSSSDGKCGRMNLAAGSAA
jgi:hypothetical protein